MSRTVIAVDFDGTIVKHEWPRIGAPVPGALETLSILQATGNVDLILWTIRSGETLDAAVKYCAANGIIFYGVNKNPDQTWSDSQKAYAQIYIDDAALGCPLIHPEPKTAIRPWVDWLKVAEVLHSKYNLIKRTHLELIADYVSDNTRF